MKQIFPGSAFFGAPVRSHELAYLINCIQRGWCCSVVGPSNTGKSHLLKSLTSETIRQRCAQDGLAPTMVFIDCLEAGDDELAFYELLFRRIIEALELSDAEPTVLDYLTSLHQDILRSRQDVVARSNFASGIRELGRRGGPPLVLVLDEFYDVFQHLPPWPFRQLRALYDAPETQIYLVTATSHHLEQLRPGKEVYEFRELFHLRELVLKPLVEDEAHQLIEYLTDQYRDSLSTENAERLIELSGGHPGLLERLYSVATLSQTDLNVPLDLPLADLLHERAIHKECLRLWRELEAEHEALVTLIERGADQLNSAQRQLLEYKGLMVDKGYPAIFSPVFGAFIAAKQAHAPSSQSTGLRAEAETGRIWIDDEELTLKLSEPQRRLIDYLYRRAGVVCTYDEIAIGVWGVGEGVSPGAIYELVKRVRQKVEPDWKNPQYIVTVPGKGYRLENPS